MKIHFYLRYSSRVGEAFSVQLSDGRVLPLDYLNESYWFAGLELQPGEFPAGLAYTYIYHAPDGLSRPEADPGRVLQLGGLKGEVSVYDYYNPMGQIENVFATQPFNAVNAADTQTGAKTAQKSAFSHLLRVKAPLLGPNEALCLLGHGKTLRDWDTAAPLLLTQAGAWWEIRLQLAGDDFPLGYKYGVWNTQTHRFLGFEEGSNRFLAAPQGHGITVCHDNFTRLPLRQWRGAGVSIPVFSLRSRNSWGIGEFTDIPALADWAKSTGFKLIQLLPINDTSATKTWTDSYPYAAISAFALHPIYINLDKLAGKKNAALLKPYQKQQKTLNALDAVDYEAVLQTKWDVLRQLYDLQKADWLKDKAWQEFYTDNKHWLAPYAVFCWLRDLNGSSDFNRWGKYAVYKPADVEKLLSSLAPGAKGPVDAQADQIGLHLFVQWHLHLQLSEAVGYAHRLGLSLKGDIPIGIYRYSCDAWVAPELYNMQAQAGAPPDDFAVNGQNWGFPTYNWARMKADGFAWWKQRFEQMSLYFDAFRIDHILGFFRIWSIPMDAVEGILGQFVPAIPVTEQELQEAGIGFNVERLCRPYITEQVLIETFGERAATVAEQFLDISPEGRFRFKKAYDTQRKLDAWIKAQPPSDGLSALREGLMDLHANVILLEAPQGYAFRFGIEKTASFRHLPEEVKGPLKALYVNYFYRRQDDFWQREAMEKLPALKAATQMLICGEDLGMVPDCVPSVMQELGILSLEIQRMPKASGYAFMRLPEAPYLSVVTPGTHDMDTLRGWWEENRDLTQRYYNEILQETGPAPYYCEPWVMAKILRQHFDCPAMWCIVQVQDLLGIDAHLRRENPHDERINIPANPTHYWRYRMHIDLETLAAQQAFNDSIRHLVHTSNRM